MAAKTVTFAQDRKRENIPVVGPVGTAIGQTTAEFAENPTVENGARMVGAYSGGVLLTAGGAELAGRAAPRSGITAEPYNSQVTNPFPDNGIYSRVMPKKYAEAFKRGEGNLGTGDEVFVGASDDLAGIDTVSGVQQRLSLFTDYERTVSNMSGDAVVQFKLRELENVGIRTPIETVPPRGFGFKQGGETAGGAREWNINNGTASDLGAYDIEIKYLQR